MNSNEDEYKNCYRADEKLVPKLQDIAAGFNISRCLHIAAKLNISRVLGTSLENKKEISEIAIEVGVDNKALLMLMRILVAGGVYLETGNGIFGHNEESLAMSDPYVRDEIIMYGEPYFINTWENLIDSIKSGKSEGLKKYQVKNFYEYLIQHPDQELTFSKGMTALSKRTTPVTVKLGGYDKFDTICDLGGSHGILLGEILKNCPNVKKVINFDQPSVLQKLKGSHERPCIDDPRYSEVEGDFFESVPPADCYTLKFIIHNWDDKKSKVILNNIAKSIKPGGKVHVIELILEDGIKENQLYFRMLNLEMLHLFDASERTKKQFEVLIEDTPFKIETFIFSEMIHSQHTIVLSLK